MGLAFDESRERMRVVLGGRAMSGRERDDAADAAALLSGRASLVEAARFWLAGHPSASGKTLNALCAEFLLWMKSTKRKLRSRGPGGYRDESVRDAGRKLKRLCEEMGHMDVAEFSPAVFLAWVGESPGSALYHDNVRRMVQMLFSWATAEGGPLRGQVNAFAGMRALTGSPGVPVVWTPEQVAAWMGACEQPAAFALLFFAGLRPEEVVRLRPKDVGTEILIRAEVSKTGRARVVSIVDNCRRWLTAYPFKGVKASTMRNAREAACKALGVAWVSDVPRHCYATYGAALWGMDRAADELGHTSTAMLHRHYRGLVRNRREAAERYFAIRPQAR
jgi:integrase